MQHIFFIGGFPVQFPLFLLGIVDGDVILSALEAQHISFGRAIVAFTDFEQAESFLAQRGGPPGTQLATLNRPAGLHRLVAFAESRRIRCIAFDPGRGSKLTAFTLSQVRAAAVAWGH
jgi:hypothetical protein